MLGSPNSSVVHVQTNMFTIIIIDGKFNIFNFFVNKLFCELNIKLICFLFS